MPTDITPFYIVAILPLQAFTLLFTSRTIETFRALQVLINSNRYIEDTVYTINHESYQMTAVTAYMLATAEDVLINTT